MCKNEKCERHEYDYGLCLIHLRERLQKMDADLQEVLNEEPKRKRTTRKKVDDETLEVRDKEEEE